MTPFRLVLKGLQVPNTNLPGNNYQEEILFGYLAGKSRYWCFRSKFRRKHFWEEKFSKHFTRMTRKSTYATSDAATSEGERHWFLHHETIVYWLI